MLSSSFLPTKKSLHVCRSTLLDIMDDALYNRPVHELNLPTILTIHLHNIAFNHRHARPVVVLGGLVGRRFDPDCRSWCPDNIKLSFCMLQMFHYFKGPNVYLCEICTKRAIQLPNRERLNSLEMGNWGMMLGSGEYTRTANSGWTVADHGVPVGTISYNHQADE